MRVTGPDPDQLVMTVVPQQRGTVVVEGLSVSYQYGFKRGTENIGEYVRLVTPDHA
jgi:hypothetical protein